MFLLFACAQSPGDFTTMLNPPVVETVEVIATADDPQVTTGGFADMKRDPACIDDPLNCEDEPSSEPVAEVVEAVVEAVEAIEPPAWTGEQVEEPEPVVSAPPPIGMPSQPAWGVRLLQTLHTASPPRAALGLPGGDEVVVAPGSILADEGVIVIAVGDGMVQLAKVEAEGDHAEIETVTLTAQYGRDDG